MVHSLGLRLEMGKRLLEEKRGQESWTAMISVLVGLTLMFFLAFFNRFAGLRSGAGEYANGMAFLAGNLPYRNHFDTGPPLNVLRSAILLKCFGGALIVSRIAGVVDRLWIGVILLRWLAQLFRPWHALVATVVTMIVSAGDLTDPIASYNHQAVLFAVLAGLCASMALQEGADRRAILLGLAAGASAGLSLLTRQTVGLGVVACLWLAPTILLAKIDGRRRAFVWSVSFGAGCAIPLAALALWLSRERLVGEFFRMLFVAGPAAKAGHASDFLIRYGLVARDNPLWVLPALIGLGLSWRAIQRGLHAPNSKRASWNEQVIWVVAGVVVIGTAEALAFTSLPTPHDFSKCSVYYVLIGLTVWLAGQMGWLVRPGISRRAAQAILLGALAWSTAVMFSLSWPAFEPMTIPGLAFLLAAMLDGLRDLFRWFALLVLAAMVFLQVRDKLDRPFGFDGQNEAPVRFANMASSQPQLRGMRLPPEMVKFLDQTAGIIREHTQPDDTIFTYPEMGLFYPLTGRRYPTWSSTHNVDVVNDAFSREEAQRLVRARPAVIVYYRQPEETLREQERIWRDARRSGQRDIIAAVESLVKTYQLAGTYTATPGGPPISVYIRP